MAFPRDGPRRGRGGRGREELKTSLVRSSPRGGRDRWRRGFGPEADGKPHLIHFAGKRLPSPEPRGPGTLAPVSSPMSPAPLNGALHLSTSTVDHSQVTCPKPWRHSFAMPPPDANIDPLVRQRTLGHRPTTGTGLGMTATYTHTRRRPGRAKAARQLRMVRAGPGGPAAVPRQASPLSRPDGHRPGLVTRRLDGPGAEGGRLHQAVQPRRAGGAVWVDHSRRPTADVQPRPEVALRRGPLGAVGAAAPGGRGELGPRGTGARHPPNAETAEPGRAEAVAAREPERGAEAGRGADR
jgi:hypothetical protein